MKERAERELIARRVAREIDSGQVVHLGEGLPAILFDQVPQKQGVMFYSDNGVMGYGPRTSRGGGNPDLVDYAGGAISLVPGGSIMHEADSLGMVRGGYVDVAVLEPFQVSERGLMGGPISSALPRGVPVRAKRVIAMMEHTSPDGSPRIVKDCDYPLNSGGCVDLIVTDVAVVQVSAEGLTLKEIAPGWSLEMVREVTGVRLSPSPNLKEMEFHYPLGKPFNKVYPNADEAVADIHNGDVLLLDGFAGPGGTPQYLILALQRQGAEGLTMVSNTAGIAEVGFGTPPGFRPIDNSILVENGQVKKAVASFPVSPSPSVPSAFELAYRRGEVQLELVPQGTLAERIRAGGYGIGGFYTPTGVGTLSAQGKETRTINGREYLLEYGIKGDFALIRAHVADKMGNLIYKGTSRNFNAVMAPAADVTIAEVDEIVEVGELDPDAIVTPGVFVQRIVRRPTDFQPYKLTT